MRIRAAAFSDPGPVRERNEDGYCLGPFVEQGLLTGLTLDVDASAFHRYGFLAAVADGMGGYNGGAEASRIVLETLSALFYSDRRDGCTAEELKTRLADYIAQSCRVLQQSLQRSAELQQAGTTLAGIAMATPDVLVVFHIGDSRVLRMRDGYIRALTIDHTPLGPDIASGRVTEEDAAGKPDGLRLTRSLGLVGDTTPDFDAEMTWTADDTFFISSDGCHGVGRGLPREAIREKIANTDDTEQLARELVSGAIQAYGQDNATAIVVRVIE